MSQLTNKEICKAVKDVESLREEVRERKGVIRRTERRLLGLERKLQAAEETDLIHNGVPLKVYGRSALRIFAVSSSVRRFAFVYRNANNHRRWGLRLHYFLHSKPGAQLGGEFMGADWKRQKDALEAAKDWVATEKKPKYNGK